MRAAGAAGGAQGADAARDGFEAVVPALGRLASRLRALAGADRYLWISIWSVVVFLLLWFLVTRFWVVGSEAVPSPQALFATFVELLRHGYTSQPLWFHVLTSLQEALGGYALGILIGVPVGLRTVRARSAHGHVRNLVTVDLNRREADLASDKPPSGMPSVIRSAWLGR